MVMAGGSGGHVFPGLAVAHYLQSQGWEIRWLGTRDRMEAQLVPKHGIDIDFIEITGLRGKGVKALLTAPFRIAKAVKQAKKLCVTTSRMPCSAWAGLFPVPVVWPPGAVVFR